MRRAGLKPLWLIVASLSLTLSVHAEASEISAGERVFRNQCLGCHSIDAGENRAGPTLYGLFGRRSGSMAGFDFSPAMQAAGIEWTEETLDAFLESPRDVVPDTKMVFWGLEEKERAQVILYLKSRQ